MIRTLHRETPPTIELPHDRDPRLASGATPRRRLLGETSAAQRAKLVLERYPELLGLPNCDCQRLKLHTVFSILHGASSLAGGRLCYQSTTNERADRRRPPPDEAHGRDHARLEVVRRNGLGKTQRSSAIDRHPNAQ